MATIKDIAQKAGVSIGTVDRVLHNRGMVNEQTKKRINEIIRELNYTPNHAAQGLAVRKKKLKLGFFLPELEGHPFFSDVQTAAEKKAKELEQYGVQVFFNEMMLHQMVDDKEKIRYFNLLEELDGFAIIGVDIPVIRELIQKAEDRNIPVVFYNLMLPGEEYLAYVGADYIKAGQLAAGLCALAGGVNARICIYSEYFEGMDRNSDFNIVFHDERFFGFCEEIKKRYPDMIISDKRLISTNQIDNYMSVQDMMKEHPDVNIIYVINPGDYGICEAISKADKKHQIRIITNDLVETQIEMVRQEVIAATVCQEPEKQGEKPLDILFHYLAYNIVPNNKMYYTNLSIHISQNT